ncbi:MAG: ComEC/Rec2 family competence protein, partial [Turicibacter sp.]|nr:ComEC/Rec2 family competence protein [Turicibacter sp.]
VVVFGRILYRDQDALASVSFACMLLLLYEPLYLFSVGFQLSFGTVFGIVLLTKPTERALSKFLPPTAFRQLLAYNIVASVSTYPILAYYFSYISTYSILVNMIVAPTFVLLVVLGMVMGLIGLVSLGVASFLGGAVYYILQFYEFVAGFFLSLPGSIWLLGNWGLLVTVASLACMLAFGFMYSGFGEIFAKRAKIMVVVSVFLVTAIAFESLNRRNFNVTALDVGSYVVTYGSSSFVVNGGGNNRLLGMNTGATTIMPYLDRRGINTANAAFVTATNRQNIMGLIELAMQNRVTILYAPEWLDLSSGLGLRLQTEARRNNIDIQILALGDTVQLADMYFILTTEGLQLFYREHGFVF